MDIIMPGTPLALDTLESKEREDQREDLSTALLSEDQVAEYVADIEDPANLIENIRKDLITAWQADNYYPTQYNYCSKQTAYMALALVCAACASDLYYVATENDGFEVRSGSIGSNAIQNAYFAYHTAAFFVDFYKAIGAARRQEDYKLISKLAAKFAFSAIIALFATAPSTIATYKFKKGFFDPTLNAIGNFPLNIFGIFQPLQQLLDWMEDEPEAREHLLDILFQEKKRSSLTKTLGITLGVPFGIFLTAAQGGYVCNSSKFFHAYVSLPGAITLGTLDNGPSLILALSSAGISLGKQTVNKIADIFHVATGNKSLSVNQREAKLHAICLAACGVTAYLAYYSNKTAKALYEDDCPQMEGALNAMLLISVVHFTQLFNWIWSSTPVVDLANYRKMAYAPPEDRKRYEIDSQKDYIKNAPIDKIRPLAIEAGYVKKPKRESACSRWTPAIWKKPASEQNLIPGQEPEHKQRWCSIM